MFGTIAHAIFVQFYLKDKIDIKWKSLWSKYALLSHTKEIYQVESTSPRTELKKLNGIADLQNW